MIEPPSDQRPPEVPPEASPVPWRARDGIAIWLLAFLIAGFVGALAFADFERGGVECSASCLIASLWANELALLALTFGWVRLRHAARSSALGFRPVTLADIAAGARTAVLGLLTAYGALTVVVAIQDALTSGPVEVPQQMDFGDETVGAGLIAMLGIVVVVLAPLAEETFFRGFLYRGLRRWARPGPAILLSSILFGAAHFIPLFILTTALLGLLLGRLVEQRGSIVPSIVAHMVFNGVGYVLLLTQI